MREEIEERYCNETARFVRWPRNAGAVTVTY